jgi:hypothetical protein
VSQCLIEINNGNSLNRKSKKNRVTRVACVVDQSRTELGLNHGIYLLVQPSKVSNVWIPHRPNEPMAKMGP